MNSRIFSGQIMHQRLEPVPHGFGYGLYFVGIDLAELSHLHQNLRLFGYNRFAPLSFRDADYLDRNSKSVEDKIRGWLTHTGGNGDVDQIFLVTCARYFNYVFNPVNFYLCFADNGELSSLVVEVNNTFGEKHVYAMHRFQRLADGWRTESPEQKAFHVSPFNDMQGAYEFIVRRPEREIELQVNLFREGKPVFLATMTGKALPLTNASIAKTLARYPVRAALTMPRILLEAAKLHFRRKLAVHKKPEPASDQTIRRKAAKAQSGPLVKRVFSLFSRIRLGALEVELPGGQRHRFGDPHSAERGFLNVRDMGFFRRVALGGAMGFGESYVDGCWDSPDPTRVLIPLARNQEHLAPDGGLLSAAARAASALLHMSRRNTKSGSRKNIQEHYDLGNDFYRTFLDPTMTYSCGLYLDETNSLQQAQLNKIHRLIDHLDLRPDHHVLEIGSGWGSCAMEMARQVGCRVTSITLSNEQLRLANERVREAGLADLVEVKLCDYRDVEGTYDRIVSIEMLEAVGHQYFGLYFTTLDRLLKPDGRVGIQVITIPDERYPAYRSRCDWIQKYIFPGGFLPSPNALRESWEPTTSFTLDDDFNMGSHYARTLREWRERFVAELDTVRSQGFDDTFIRKWIYYLCYCEAGFTTGMIDVRQLILAREPRT